MSTKQICEDVIAAKRLSLKKSDKPPRCSYLNCFTIQEKIEEVLEKIGTSEASLKRGDAIILILDEVDQLIGKKSTEAVLSKLMSWGKNKNYSLSVIGISNAINNRKIKQLQDRYGIGLPSHRCIFRTYRKQELVRITEAKIGFSVVDKKTHEFIAAKVANSSGDARKYLDLVTKAVQNLKDRLPQDKKDLQHEKPIVMIRDAMQAIRETNRKSKEIIDSLTSLEKMTLCAGVHLARKFSGNVTTLGMLRQLIMDAFDMDANVSLDDFKGIIERLQDSGVLRLIKSGRGSFQTMSLINRPVAFDMQLEDVDSALQDTVLKEDFYKRMVKRVETMKI